MVDEAGITPLPRHVAAIQDCPPPADIKQLQRFLGLINFYRRFLSAVARTLQPLTDLLKGSPKVLLWSPAAEAAFVAAKAALVAAVPLCHPAPNAVLSLSVDASDSHVGGVLQQQVGKGWKPLAFFSKKLAPAEIKYSTFDRELLAAFATIRHFRFLLEGRQFRLLTDHKPLVAAMFRVTPPQSARQQRHLAYISEFTTDLRHTPWSDNVVADALSRPPPVLGIPAQGLPVLSIPQLNPPSEPPRQTASQVTAADAQPIDFLDLSFAQPSCPDVQTMLVSPSLSVVSRKYGSADVLGDVSTGVFRPLLPARFRSAAMLSLHNIHHPGIKATRRLVCASFCWPKMGLYVSALTRNCLHCQKAKVHRHVALQAAHIPVPVRRFSHIYTSTWLVRCLALQDSHTCSQSSTGRLAGRKRCRSLLPPPPTAQRPSCRDGSSDSGYRAPSKATGVLSSHLRCGLHFVRSSPSNTLRQPPIILSPTALWRDSTAA
jgi:hypothetical protein